jgi:hypothetical protein
MSNPAKTGEILFVKAVKDGIPNRDPLRDSDARRIFGEDDGRISLSDVSIKRDVRDYVLDRYPDGGDDKSMFVFVRKERVEGNKLLGREKLAESLLEKAGRAKEADIQTALMKSAFDTRVFGAVLGVVSPRRRFSGNRASCDREIAGSSELIFQNEGVLRHTDVAKQKGNNRTPSWMSLTAGDASTQQIVNEIESLKELSIRRLTRCDLGWSPRLNSSSLAPFPRVPSTVSKLPCWH